MSFDRLNYDPCTYQHDVNQSVRVGQYQFQTPMNPAPCFFDDPRIRLQSQGVARCRDLISVDSEMLGITRRHTKCPTEMYPAHEYRCAPMRVPDCPGDSWTEDTRLSNPPCTLKGTGWNRWEWLPSNPQDKALLPFQTNVNTSIVVKDNHRPLLPTPLPQALYPQNSQEPTFTEQWLAGRSFVDTTVTWRTCDEVRRM